MNNYNFNFKNLIKFIFLYAILFSKFIYSNSSEYHCLKRMLISEDIFNSYYVDKLCKYIFKINNINVFLRLIPNISRLEYSDLKGSDYEYDNDSELEAKLACTKNNISCDYTALITVYFKARKIRVSVGQNLSRNILSSSIRRTIINKMSVYLKDKNYYNAFEEALNIINYNSNLNIDNTYSDNSDNKKINYSDEFKIFLVVFVLFIAAVIIFNNCESNKINKHYNKLTSFYKQNIKTKNPKVCSTNKCLICLNTLNKNLTKFSCNHYFHSKCINNPVCKANKLDCYCLMCDEPTAINNDRTCDYSEYYHNITEKNVFNVLNNFDKIYSKDELKNYYINYNNESKSFRDYAYNDNSWIYDSFYENEYIKHINNTRRYYSDKNINNNNTDNSSNFKTSGGDYDNSSSNFNTNGGDYNDGGTSGGDY